MWGIDKWNRIYLALKYKCDSAGEGAMALFQRYYDSGDTIAQGHHGGVRGCDTGSFSYPRDPTPEFLDQLGTLLYGETVVGRSSISLSK